MKKKNPVWIRYQIYDIVTLSENRFSTLEKTGGNHKEDGLNGLSNNFVIKLEELYTFLIVP